MRKRKLNLATATVAITGSTGGIGDALATALVKRGTKVACLDLDPERTAEQARRLGRNGCVVGYGIDVRDQRSLERALQKSRAQLGPINAVIAGAAVSSGVDPFETARADDWENTIDINLHGIWRTFKAGLPYVDETKGHLMAISSLAAFVPVPFMSAYSPSKAAIWALCNTLRLELEPRGITVGSAHPPFIRTPMTEPLLVDAAMVRLTNNFSGVWEFAKLDKVVEDITRGLRRRDAHVITPRKLYPVAKAPGLFRPLIEYRAYKGNAIGQAMTIALARNAPTINHNTTINHDTTVLRSNHE